MFDLKERPMSRKIRRLFVRFVVLHERQFLSDKKASPDSSKRE